MISTLSHAASSTENDLAGIIAQKDFLLSQLRAHNHELAIKLESTQRQLTNLQHQIEQLLRRL